MKTLKIAAFILGLFWVEIVPALAQGPLQLTLEEVIHLAKAQSLDAKQALTTKETRYWEYRVFQSDYKPQFLLNGTLPGFTRNFQEVVQPDGTILFQQVSNNNSSVGLFLQQNISATGGVIYATSQLQRFDDFDRDKRLYNGTLFAVGFEQPLFGFNQLKWNKKIEPLRFEESKRTYLEDLEGISILACELYFNLLMAQVNQRIASANLQNTTAILEIAKEKFDLGKISHNEILQLELELLKAKKAIMLAARDVEIATLELRSFIGLDNKQQLQLETAVPLSIPSLQPDQLLKEAFINKAIGVGFQRRSLEAKQGVQEAKAESGFSASISANFGLSNTSSDLGELVQQPKDYQSVFLQFNIPILDWGRAQARKKTAEANAQLVEYAIERDRQSFEQEIYTQVTLFEMLKQQLTLATEADRIASDKYEIANERYTLGNLSITDLSIAFTEKDQAKRDFITVLRDYWLAYYNLRYLTLFDFETNKKITE